MLEITNAVKVFAPSTPNEMKALNGLNLKLEDGEFVTIIGSNGAGKSTLFNAICGIRLDCANDEVVEVGLAVASGAMDYEALLAWVRAHRA